MDYLKLTAIATSMIAFTGFLIGIFTIVYYSYQIKETINLLSVITGVYIYIVMNLLFLYVIKREMVK